MLPIVMALILCRPPRAALWSKWKNAGGRRPPAFGSLEELDHQARLDLTGVLVPADEIVAAHKGRR